MGGDLVSVHNPTTNRIVYNLVVGTVTLFPEVQFDNAAGNTNATAWIGVKLTSATAAVNVDGTALDYQNWAAGEPDVFKAYPAAPEACAVIGEADVPGSGAGGIAASNGTWADLPCHKDMVFVLCARAVPAGGGCPDGVSSPAPPSPSSPSPQGMPSAQPSTPVDPAAPSQVSSTPGVDAVRGQTNATNASSPPRGSRRTKLWPVLLGAALGGVFGAALLVAVDHFTCKCLQRWCR